jgi:hypothetical protein
MTREFNSARAQQNIGALAVERLAGGVAMKRFRPPLMGVLVAFGAA